MCRYGYCLSATLQCGMLNCSNVAAVDPFFATNSVLARLCELQRGFCHDIQAGKWTQAYWGSVEPCSLGLTPIPFSDYPEILVNLTCCNADKCNAPTTPPPKPTCKAMSISITGGFCGGSMVDYKTCSVGSAYAEVQAYQTTMVRMPAPVDPTFWH